MAHDQLMDELANAFRSARLEYVRVNPDDAALKDFIPQVVHDPVIQAMSSSMMLRPKTKKDFEDTLQWLSSSLLGVAICLPAPDQSKDEAPKDDAGANHRTIIGFVCITTPKDSVAATHHRNAEIGISLANKYQGQGYGREALNWMLDWGFKHAALHTISILAASYNPRALHLYESIGFVVEGRRRETIWQNRKWYDLVEFGITETEWEKLRES